MDDHFFCVDRRVIGTKRHLMVEPGDHFWVHEVPDDTWHIGGRVVEDDPRCVDTLFALELTEFDAEPPVRFKRAMWALMSGSSSWPPPWASVMPVQAHRDFVERLVTDAGYALAEASKEYFRRAWVPETAVYAALRRATIDSKLLCELRESGDGNQASLATFEPQADGLALPVTYNRFGTRTGRPTVQSGPLILTLKKEHRKVIRSRWGDAGTICAVDFAALEARVLLYEAGRRCDDADMYQALNDELFDGRAKRDDVKGAVISELYGQSKWALGARLGIAGDELDTFIQKVRSYFNTKGTLKRTKDQFVAKGWITNRYGRKVVIEEPIDRIFVNSYAQSTGADVALLGFKQVIERMQGRRFEPLFLIFDGMVVDCHNDDLPALESITHVVVDGYVQRWPLKVVGL